MPGQLVSYRPEEKPFPRTDLDSSPHNEFGRRPAHDAAPILLGAWRQGLGPINQASISPAATVDDHAAHLTQDMELSEQVPAERSTGTVRQHIGHSGLGQIPIDTEQNLSGRGQGQVEAPDTWNTGNTAGSSWLDDSLSASSRAFIQDSTNRLMTAVLASSQA